MPRTRRRFLGLGLAYQKLEYKSCPKCHSNAGERLRRQGLGYTITCAIACRHEEGLHTMRAMITACYCPPCESATSSSSPPLRLCRLRLTPQPPCLTVWLMLTRQNG